MQRKKRPWYPAGDPAQDLDWRKASRGARYCLQLRETKMVKMMVKLFRYIEHKMLDDLL